MCVSPAPRNAMRSQASAPTMRATGAAFPGSFRAWRARLPDEGPAPQRRARAVRALGAYYTLYTSDHWRADRPQAHKKDQGMTQPGGHHAHYHNQNKRSEERRVGKE